MRRTFAFLAVVVGRATGAACRRHPVRTLAPEPAPPRWQYCWWTLVLTTLPPDSVATHFARAFTATGQVHATWTHDADTTWVHAGPTPLDGAPAGASFESRAVAYRQSDTTRFRYFVAFTPPPRGWARAAEADEAGRRQLPLCVSIAQATAIPWRRPDRGPNAEDSLAIWSRVP